MIELSVAAMAREYQCILAAPGGGEFAALASLEGARFVQLSGARSTPRISSLFDAMGFFKSIQRTVSDHNIRIIYAFGLKALVASCLVSIFNRNVQVIFGVRWDVSEKNKLNTIMKMLAKVMKARITAVIVNSQHSAKTLVRDRTFDAKKIKVIKNGKNLHTVIKSKRRTGNRHVILTVANLTPVKNHERYIVECIAPLLKRQPDLQFRFAGRDELDGRLQRLVCAASLQNNVFFTGFKDDVTPELQAADVVVLPSKSEGLPMSIIEAMVCEKPVVAFDVGGVAELVDHQASGFVVTPFDWVEMQQAIETLATDPGLRTKYGAAARAKAESEFAIAKMWGAHKQIFDEVLQIAGE